MPALPWTAGPQASRGCPLVLLDRLDELLGASFGQRSRVDGMLGQVGDLRPRRKPPRAAPPLRFEHLPRQVAAQPPDLSLAEGLPGLC